LIPNCGNSTGESPYSFANQHAAPLVTEVEPLGVVHVDDEPALRDGASPEPASSSRASVKNRSLTAQATHIPDLGQVRECPLTSVAIALVSDDRQLVRSRLMSVGSRCALLLKPVISQRGIAPEGSS
jgi:hypothetical protein